MSATAVEPSERAKQTFVQARKHLMQGELASAREWANATIEEAPDFISGRRLLADILIQQGEFDGAQQQLTLALERIPESRERRMPVLLHLATACVQAGDLAQALGVLNTDEFAKLDGVSTALLNQLGYLHTLCESHACALAAYEAICAREPDNPLVLFNCAAANRAMGNLQRAEQLYDQVIARNPQDWEAYKNRSDLRRQKPGNNHVAGLTALLGQDDMPAAANVQLNFALAKELEDLGEHASSFAALARGCSARRALIDYDITRDSAVMVEIARRFDAHFFTGHAVPADQGREIIFILGMPRTGSTLLDRILCASPEVVSAGEPDTFARLLLSEAGKTSDAGNGNIILQAAEAVDISRVGERYVEQLRARAVLLGGQKIIDKNPMNFLYLGWLARALPAAKFIHLCRDPMDTCYAVLKTLFKSAYPFSYDQRELGQYYAAYRRLMRHWQSVLPGRIIDVHYESLVEDLGTEGRRVYQQCGLHWYDEFAGTYHTNTQGTATASAAQVRQPVYRTSLGKWKNYRDELVPLAEILQQEKIIGVQRVCSE